MAKVTKAQIEAKKQAAKLANQEPKKGWLSELEPKKQPMRIPVRLSKAGYKNTFWG